MLWSVGADEVAGSFEYLQVYKRSWDTGYRVKVAEAHLLVPSCSTYPNISLQRFAMNVLFLESSRML